MINREIPFRPKLEGEFRVRFYDAVSGITGQSSIVEIQKIIDKEIDWVQNICTFNLSQRKKYRAIWMLFQDLVRASWKVCYRDGVLYMTLPCLNDDNVHNSFSNETLIEAKKLIRSWMSDSRQERLNSCSDFIQRMEKRNASGHDISELIAEGNELSERVEKACAGEIDLDDAVQPYLQLVNGDEKDKFTGFKLSEIWRYFRLTWSNPAEPTPGRTMQYLIRDAAHPMHAVMGIASLENCTVQITCRDNFIGWNPKAFIEELIKLDVTQAKNKFADLLHYIEVGISGIDYSKFCTKAVIENPTDQDIREILDCAVRSEQQRKELLEGESKNGIEDSEKSEFGNVSQKTLDALYSRKRADQLGRLLKAKKAILDIYNSKDFAEIWIDFCKSDFGSSMIRCALIAQKSQHIGSSLLELNVCGAIPPYNEILGGKLVALLATSPQVIHDYKNRYANKASMIATLLKGEDVCRPADLVYIGTTSLYYVGSSQYNRLKIPGKVFGSDYDIDWKRLGTTTGYGTLHISKTTTLSLTEATSENYNRINHVFGEGASPKLRLVTMAIHELLESTNEGSKDFTKHAMSRIVYGACLAKNTQAYLMGKADKPEYYTDLSHYQEGTQKIIDFWRNRWLKSRLNYRPIYQKMRAFDKAEFLVGNQIKGSKKWEFKKLEEVSQMPVNDGKKVGLKFVRDFYRGSSAYADHIDTRMLSHIHLKTKLDDAVINAVKVGKDVVFTGNPGDGKTHIIRVLKEKLEAVNPKIVIELDASTLSDEDIYKRWKSAKEANVPFVIAINAAVLHSVYKNYSEFEPIKNAYLQMVSAVVFHNECQNNESVVVFDLSKREVLTEEILGQVIMKMTDDVHYHECEKCPLVKVCVVHKNRKLLKDRLFQKRLIAILQRVSLRGYHATLREVQSFVAYLIFGDRSCEQLNKTNGNSEYDLVNLVYSGKGNLFKAINSSIDPVKISHPIWDEKILSNKVESKSWVDGYEVPSEAIAFDNEDLFNLRKRQFFFFNKHGEELLSLLDDDATRFQQFLSQDDKVIKRELISKLNSFFGKINDSNGKLQVWIGHRYNNEPRKILISNGVMSKKDFNIGRPMLLCSMQDGIDMTSNYVRFEKKNSSDIFLKIDFGMYILLREAERGVPVLFTDSDLVKKIWRFVEQLQSFENIEDEDSVEIGLIDVRNKSTTMIEIDRDDNKYSSIKRNV